MKSNNAIFNFSTCFAILLSSSLASCTTTTPSTQAEAQSKTLTGQKPINGSPPKTITAINPTKVRQAFGYDFNRDKTPDWVVIVSQPHGGDSDGSSYAIAVYLSQPNGSHQDVCPSTFDPGSQGNSDQPWAVSAELLDSGDLLISNNTSSAYFSGTTRNRYRFRYQAGEFVLQEYVHSYGSGGGGASYRFDLANHVYRKSDKKRCDSIPETPCPTATTQRLGTVPTMTLGNFAGYANADIVRDLEKYAVK